VKALSSTILYVGERKVVRWLHGSGERTIGSDDEYDTNEKAF